MCTAHIKIMPNRSKICLCAMDMRQSRWDIELKSGREVRKRLGAASVNMTPLSLLANDKLVTVHTPYCVENYKIVLQPKISSQFYLVALTQ